MNRSLYYKSIGDLGRYHATVDSLIISLFKEDRKKLMDEKQRQLSNIERGGIYKEEATNDLYMLCVDLLQSKYLSKQIQRKEIRKETEDVLEDLEDTVIPAE